MRIVFALWLSVVIALLPASARADASPAPPPPPKQDVHSAPTPNNELSYRQPFLYPTGLWFVLQLIPGPELAFGTQHHIDVNGSVDKSINPAFGLRWELDPIVWSFGVHRKQSPWRFFIADPIARLSGSLELSTVFEYVGGQVDRVLARPGLRVYLPVAQRGEYLSMSFGTSVYSYDGLRVAYDVGAWILSGFVGFQITVAPTHAPLATIASLRLRFF